MEYLGIEYDIKNIPLLDKSFVPLGPWARAYLADARRPFWIAAEREDGQIAALRLRLRGEGFAEANYRFAERMVKLLLWSAGGFRVYVAGDEGIADRIRQAYSPKGERAFDAAFMEDVYERPFEVIACDDDSFPRSSERAKRIGGFVNGCRIGFDAGGSDVKVSAVIDGESVYSEEIVWHPKTQTDPSYHFNGIRNAMLKAAEKMPRVDGIGVSSAGVYIDNRAMVASLFIKLSEEDKIKCQNIYLDVAKTIGKDIPIEVANDGDVTALAGAMDLNDNCVLGIAMGTSEAGGYVDQNGNITGWLNELAFVPVDMNPDAMVDEWSGDVGCGVKYFSQDSVIKLCPAAGIELDDSLTLAEKLKYVQNLHAAGDPRTPGIYETIGVYFGYQIAYYAKFYDIRHVLIMGRVTSGQGGQLLLQKAQEVLNTEYPELAKKIQLHIPDENSRRVGQSVAAASLPVIKK